MGHTVTCAPQSERQERQERYAPVAEQGWITRSGTLLALHDCLQQPDHTTQNNTLIGSTLTYPRPPSSPITLSQSLYNNEEDIITTPGTPSQQNNTARAPTAQQIIKQLILRVKNLEKNKPQKDQGEVVRPTPPGPFAGDVQELDGFRIQLQAYFEFFPTKLKEDKDKVRFAGTHLTGTAGRWFQAYLRNWYDNEAKPELRNQETVNLLTSYDNFIIALTAAFGKVDYERQAVKELKELRQIGAASGYTAKFREVASRLDWNDTPLKTAFYDRLKEEVKDRLFELDEPEDLSEYMATAVRIDNRLFKRKQQKGGKRSSWNYIKTNYKPNQGAQRAPPPSTASGTHAGPMELGAVEKRKYYNCNEVGHISPQCPKPKKQKN
uniref:CCHC-type domain-containing protein n=1 Tax=Bionectria ochroleuca TaxID=29856 RepID=A0A8H7NHP3_BIOOC